MSGTENFPPRPIDNAQIRTYDLTGYLFPWHQGAPALLTMPNSVDVFLPVFSTVEKLQDLVRLVDLPIDAIKQVDNPIEFFKSMPAQFPNGTRLRVIIDPYRTAENQTRFSELLRD
jgi:hypothetical protein